MKKKTINKKRVQNDAIGLDYNLAVYVLPRLKWLEIKGITHPVDLSMEEWKCKLREMQVGFQECINYNHDIDDKPMRERKEIIKKSLKVFAEYYMDLWD